MATPFEQEIERILKGPGETPGPGIEARVDRILSGQSPADQPWGQNVPGWVTGLRDWLLQHPDQAVDLAVQTVTSGMGMVAGAPAGPVGVMGGGAAGNVAGRGMADDINRWIGLRGDDVPRPEIMSPQTVVDAGFGALGPMGGSAGRGLTRQLTGLRQRPFNRAATQAREGIRTDAKANIEGISRLMDELGPGSDRLIREHLERYGQRFGENITRNVTTEAIEGAGSATEVARRGIGGAIAGGLASAEPITGALIGAGISEAVLSRAGPAILGSRYGQDVARWALNANREVGTGRLSRTDLATTFSAIFAGQQLEPDLADAVGAIMGDLTRGETVPEQRIRLSNPERRSERRNPFEIVMTPRGERARDPITGQWTSLE